MKDILKGVKLPGLVKPTLYVTDEDLVAYLSEYGHIFEVEELMDLFYDWLADVLD